VKFSTEKNVLTKAIRVMREGVFVVFVFQRGCFLVQKKFSGFLGNDHSRL
jgi:hypothetical protein